MIHLHDASRADHIGKVAFAEKSRERAPSIDVRRCVHDDNAAKRLLQ